MKWNGLRIPIIIMSILGGLLIFFGGQFLYNKYNVEKPLERIINDNVAVAEVTVEKNATGYYLEVRLRDGITEVAQVYEELYQDCKATLGRQPFKLTFKDNPDAQLNEIWRQSQYHVHQAIMQGNFPEMADNINSIATAAGVKAQIDVTDNYVFIQLTKEDGHKIIAVVARQNFMITGQVAQSGGETVAKRN